MPLSADWGLPLSTRPEPIVYFFRDVHGIYPITKQALAKRTPEYQRGVEAFARNHRIPIPWPAKGLQKENYVRPYDLSLPRRRRFGVCFICKSLEQGPTFPSRLPQFPTDDPDYRIRRRKWSRYTHYYFSVRDEGLGPMLLGIGSFLPFPRTIMRSCGSGTHQPCRRPLIGSAPRSSASAWITGR